MNFGIVGVQPYFNHNIFANTSTAYFHQGLPLEGVDVDADQLQRISPEYMVVYAIAPVPPVLSQLGALGYEVVHFSDGYLLYKRSVLPERQDYFILRRIRPGIGQEPAQVDPGR